MLRHPDLIEAGESGLLVVDIQEKFMPVIEGADLLIRAAGNLVRGFRILERPVWVTEQYPKGLGPTVAALKALFDGGFSPLEKMTFSCCGIEGFSDRLLDRGIRHIIVCGIETHVCVWQSVMDLAAAGFRVTVAGDAVSSRKRGDRETAEASMRQAGIRIASVEMILFELLKRADSPRFKEIQALVK